VVLGKLIRRTKAPKEAGKEITGTVIEKSFNPPPGAPVDYPPLSLQKNGSSSHFPSFMGFPPMLGFLV